MTRREITERLAAANHGRARGRGGGAYRCAGENRCADRKQMCVITGTHTGLQSGGKGKCVMRQRRFRERHGENEEQFVLSHRWIHLDARCMSYNKCKGMTFHRAIKQKIFPYGCHAKISYKRGACVVK